VRTVTSVKVFVMVNDPSPLSLGLDSLIKVTVAVFCANYFHSFSILSQRA
jgi:hypothetical protein